jgi:hypothetical protein
MLSTSTLGLSRCRLFGRGDVEAPFVLFLLLSFFLLELSSRRRLAFGVRSLVEAPFFFFLGLSSRRRLTFGLRNLGDEAPVLSTTSPQLGRPARDGRFGLGDGLRSLGDEAPVLSTTSPQLGRPARDRCFGLGDVEAPEMIRLR